MTNRHAYTYVLLRYVHDVMTGEFVNVGVVLYCRDASFLRAKVRSTHGRLAATFPGLDGSSFRAALRGVARSVDRIATEVAQLGLLKHDGDVVGLARIALPEDDSSLRWSPIGSGVTSDPAATLEVLFERMVSRYDEKGKPRRMDEDIWKPVRDRLKERDISVPFEPKKIRGAVDEINFKHAWKNGTWHCYEPLSFDLATAESIKDKARRWAGHLLSVQDTSEAFKPYFIVGRPQEPGLGSAFETAINVLKMSPSKPEIFREDDVDLLVDQIEQEVHLHN